MAGNYLKNFLSEQIVTLQQPLSRLLSYFDKFRRYNIRFPSSWTRNRSLTMSQGCLQVDLGGMRTEYRQKKDLLMEGMISKEPFAQFTAWFDEAACHPGIAEPNAMCLATCTSSGIPSARYVLLKAYGQNGFKFYTNYCSRKGRELAENPKAAAVFYWEPLKRSIRIEGDVEKLSEKESTEYFHTRPKNSQIGAACSYQSQPISSREALNERENEFKRMYANCDTIPKPKEWGGYILIPHSIEFWQGQNDRLHDRIRYRIPECDEIVDNVLLHQGENGWVYERLQP